MKAIEVFTNNPIFAPPPPLICWATEFRCRFREFVGYSNATVIYFFTDKCLIITNLVSLLGVFIKLCS